MATNAAKTKKQAELIQKVLNEALEATGIDSIDGTADSQSDTEPDIQHCYNSSEPDEPAELKQLPLNDGQQGTALPFSKNVIRTSEEDTESYSQPKTIVAEV